LGFTGGYNNINTSGTINNDRVFIVGRGSDNNTRSNLFSITSNGNAYLSGQYHSGGADYAEYFESKLDKKIPIGITVILDEDGFIMPAENYNYLNENIIGVISSTPNLVGNSYDDYWHNKYEKNEFGEYIYENYEYEIEEPIYEEKIEIHKKIQKINDKYYEIPYQKIKKIPLMEDIEIYSLNGDFLRTKSKQKTKNIIKKELRRKLSTNFNPNLTYIPRKKRPEWNLVGLLGQVLIKKGQPIKKNWIKIKNINDIYDLWFIK
jgi:hypothetical protein